MSCLDKSIDDQRTFHLEVVKKMINIEQLSDENLRILDKLLNVNDERDFFIEFQDSEYFLSQIPEFAGLSSYKRIFKCETLRVKAFCSIIDSSEFNKNLRILAIRECMPYFFFEVSLGAVMEYREEERRKQFLEYSLEVCPFLVKISQDVYCDKDVRAEAFRALKLIRSI